MFPWLEVPSLTYAEVLLRDPSAETRESALPFIEEALARAEAHHNVRQAIPFSLLRAEALADRERMAEALDVLAATVRRAQPFGLVRTFVDRGPRVARLLEALARRQGRGGYLGTLVSAAWRPSAPGAARERRPPESRRPPPATPRLASRSRGAGSAVARRRSWSFSPSGSAERRSPSDSASLPTRSRPTPGPSTRSSGSTAGGMRWPGP